MVVAKYGTIDRFMFAMSPARQHKILDNVVECFVGDEYPTLKNIATAYGKTAPIQWLIAQLVNLSEFCGVKEKLTGDQLEELATLLAKTYSYYKVTHFMAFFLNFKMGKYGKFYGVVDPIVITTAIQDFDKERIRIIAKWEDEQEELRKEEERKNAITYDEWLRSLEVDAYEIDENGMHVFDESVMREAQFCVDIAGQFPADLVEKYRQIFERKFGSTPDEYINYHQAKSNETRNEKA